MKKLLPFLILLIALPATISAQIKDKIYKDNIKTVRLVKQGDQLALPFINLNSNDRLQLFFDDLEGDIKSYYYTYQLCNYDWTPANVMSMDYLSGFAQNRIADYKFSATALTRYTHYQASIPDSKSLPKKSGNYILKVYLDGDTSKVVFTKRMLVVDNKASVSGKVVQPTTPGKMRAFQKVSFNVNVGKIQNFDALRQVHVSILQNFRWDNAQNDVKAAFIRGNNLEFNSESTGIFPAGKEWRWLDLRDFQLQTDRVAAADYHKKSTDIYLHTDGPLEQQPYQFYPDLDGLSLIEAVRGINPYYEGDYATVYFSYAPASGRELDNEDIYLYGQLSNYELNDHTKMVFNADKRIYEASLLLKQGYYDYTYLFQNDKTGMTFMNDGNDYEAENAYTVLVYYRPFGARTDELIAISLINSKDKRQGFGF